MGAQEDHTEDIRATRMYQGSAPATGAPQGPCASKELPQPPFAGDEDIRGCSYGSNLKVELGIQTAPGAGRPREAPGPHGQSVLAHPLAASSIPSTSVRHEARQRATCAFTVVVSNRDSAGQA